ncbi:MAG: hypothetical protein LUH47_00920, partial [Clostridiales bacterium]|nr:hypothetical protein [Clostridiales bacterium]
METEERNGRFEYIFNPVTKGISAGSTMTVTFYDQEGQGYMTHDLGVTYGRYLGTFSILTSFNTPIQPVLELVGKVSGAFGFGYSGISDDTFTTETETTDGIVKDYQSLSIGFSASWSTPDSDVTDIVGNLADAVNSKISGKGTTATANAVSTAVNATDTSSRGNNSSVELSPYASLAISVGLELVMEKSQTKEHSGEYFFSTFVFIVSGSGGAGTTVQIPTPIYINVLIGFDVSGEADGVIVVSKNANAGESYFDEEGGIDLGDMALLTDDVNSSTAAFTFYGYLRVAPSITLSAGVGWSDFLALTVSGTADFDLDFDTLGTSNGDVTLSAYLNVKLLFFSKSWKLDEGTYDLFSTGSRNANLSMLYESVESMEMADLSYMDNRTGWSGLRSVKSLDFALSDNSVKSYEYGESELITGNNPYPNGDIK